MMIPMRDGIKLHTAIYVPKSRSEALPMLFIRTPYGIGGAGRNFQGSYQELADDGYIFVFQDIRGRYTSEGEFVMMRPARDRKIPDPSTRLLTPTTRSIGCSKT